MKILNRNAGGKNSTRPYDGFASRTSGNFETYYDFFLYLPFP